MNRLLITAICAAMAFPAVSTADDHGRNSRPPSYQHGGRQHDDHHGGRGHDGGHRDNGGGEHRYYAGGRYPYYVRNPPHYHYRSYAPRYYWHGYPNYYYGRNHHDGNDDDALWAIGGLVVGAIIGNAVAHASTPPPATTSAPPANPTQQYCDRIEYDSAGNPYVERSCPR